MNASTVTVANASLFTPERVIQDGVVRLPGTVDISKPKGALAGKVAVVTGDSSGIGKTTRASLVAKGASTIDGFSRRSGDFNVCDAAQVEAELGSRRVDILVVNAGCMLLGSVADSPVEEWERMIDTNLKGALYCVRAVLPGMLERGTGDIVFVGSVLGRSTAPLAAVYCLTKFGIHAFADCLRKETVGTGVRILNIQPGRVETELRSHIRPEVLPELKRHGYAAVEGVDADAIADAVVFAVSQPRNVSVSEILVRPTGAAM